MNYINFSNISCKPLLAVITVLLLGCETAPEKTALGQNFGSSVRSMIEMQTARPDDNARGLNGQKGEAVLGIYETDVAQPKKVEQDIIQIRLGK